jgi:hypothetical protein
MLRARCFLAARQTLFVRRAREDTAGALLLNTLCRSCPAIFATGISRALYITTLFV